MTVPRRAELVVLVALATLLGACTSETGPPEAAGTQAPTEAPTSAVVGPSLLYLDGAVLKSYDLGSGEQERITRLSTADAALSPDGTRLALVEETDPGGDPEGFAAPVVSVLRVGGPGPAHDLGPGRSPHWSSDGALLAVVAPTDGTESLVVYNPAGGSKSLLGPDRWVLLGWSGPFVAAIGEGAGVVVADDKGFETIDLPPNEVWGISPTDAVVAVSREQGTSLYRDGDETPVEHEGVLGDGAWSPDGSTIAAVVLGRGGSRVALINVASGEADLVHDSERAQGNVVWSPDAQMFAYARVDPNDDTRLQAVVCTSARSCEPAFSWDQGVSLLGFSKVSQRV